jgi:membrane fusion protein, multidrug efflux system
VTRLWPQSIMVFAAALILITACSGDSNKPLQNKAKSGQAPAVPVRVATVKQEDVPLQLHAVGNVEAYSTVDVKPQLDGELAQIFFKEGDSVKKGELLFLLDTRPFEYVLRQAQANTARDTAQMNKAKEDARRYGDLVTKGVVSEQQYEQYSADYKALEATVNADKAAVEKAGLDLEYCSIRSPIDGRIGEILVHVGNTVEKRSTLLAIITQTKPVYVSFSLPEQYLSDIRNYLTAEGGLKVYAEIPKGKSESPTSGLTEEPASEASGSKTESETVTGELSFINNQVNETTGTIMLKGVFQNDNEALWPGKFVNVSLTLTMQQNALTVPAKAVQTSRDGTYVFVVLPDSTVESRPVVEGAKTGQNIVILKGLKPGERVVTEGHIRLSPGIKVTIKEGAENEV